METLQQVEAALGPYVKVLEEWPSVSIIMPVFNEERFIANSLMAALGQEYPPDRLEIIVADGMSTDNTRSIIETIQRDYSNVYLIDNPRRIVPAGLNLAIAAARGDIVVRFDGHCEYPVNYVKRVVELRQRLGAENVGGVLAPLGTTYVQKAVAAAYYSPVGLGGAALKAVAGDTCREVDAVHGGCWKRVRLMEVGGFDESMVRNQDDELSFRLRKNGGRIFQSAAIRVEYHVRSSFKKLFQQFAQYGYWKVQVIKKHPRQGSIRHLVPAMFVLTILAATLFSFFSNMGLWLLGGLLGSYLTVLVLTSIKQSLRLEKKLWPGIVAALAIIHAGYGIGFIAGFLRACCGLFPQSIFEGSSR